MDGTEKELLLQVVETSARTEEAVRGMERELTLVRQNLHNYKENQQAQFSEYDARLNHVEAVAFKNSTVIKIGLAILSALLSGAYAKLLGIITF